MILIFFPNEYLKSVYEIDYDKLKKMKITALIFDIDNTLAPYNVKFAPKKTVELFQDLKRRGFKICLLSNNKAKRVKIFNGKLNLEFISKARKPLLFGINKALRLMGASPSAACVIGDQIFSDVWCANRRGVYSILVKPISSADEFSVRIKRIFEKPIIKIIEKRFGKRFGKNFSRKKIANKKPRAKKPGAQKNNAGKTDNRKRIDRRNFDGYFAR